jgi:hypothetical protein
MDCHHVSMRLLDSHQDVIPTQIIPSCLGLQTDLDGIYLNVSFLGLMMGFFIILYAVVEREKRRLRHHSTHHVHSSHTHHEQKTD